MADRATPAALAGTFERFDIERLVGSGGMATVYRAVDRHTGDPVALKILHGRTPEQTERFEQEAGRTVYARWNWLVPPISGSAVTIFHRDSWKDIQLKPAYAHQPDPWKTDLSWKSA